MKCNLARFSALLIVVISCAFSAANADPSSMNAAAESMVTSIKTNAEAVSRNSEIYQWQRVDREVLRIAADQSDLNRALTSDGSNAEVARELDSDVKMLRAASTNRDPAKTAGAAKLVSLDCARLK